MNCKIRVRTVEPVYSESVERKFRVFDGKLPGGRGKRLF
jgi:hypothetical protein